MKYRKTVKDHLRDLQDLQYTIEDNRLDQELLTLVKKMQNQVQQVITYQDKQDCNNSSIYCYNCNHIDCKQGFKPI